jgi:hypothetical protein
MQCNAMQCNTMQCNNAMQCNASKCNVRKSVRPYGMKSVSHFFIFLFFFSQYVRKSVSIWNTNVADGQTSFFSCQYVRMSRMDRQVSVISVQFQFSRIQSSKSVRPYGGPNQKKKKKTQTNTETQIRSEVIHSMAKKFALNLYITLEFIKRDRWHNSKQTCHY